MKRIKDVNSVSVSPKFWTDKRNGHKIEWRSAQEPFEAFLAKVYGYCEANGIPTPSRYDIEDELCRQMPSWACVGEGYHTSQPLRSTGGVVVARSGGCKTCGKRR